MKSFIAYRFTGEDPEQLEPVLTSITKSLSSKGVDAYCTFFNQDEFSSADISARDIMQHAFEVINGIDFLFVLITSEAKSEGMIMEVGYCLAKDIPIVVAVKDGVSKTYIPEMALKTITWSNIQDLRDKIDQLDLKSMAV